MLTRLLLTVCFWILFIGEIMGGSPPQAPLPPQAPPMRIDNCPCPSNCDCGCAVTGVCDCGSISHKPTRPCPAGEGWTWGVAPGDSPDEAPGWWRYKESTRQAPTHYQSPVQFQGFSGFSSAGSNCGPRG